MDSFLLHFIHDESSRNIVFNLCLSDLLPMNYECSARMYNENRGRHQRDETRTKSFDSDAKCERVSPAKRRTLKEKFEIAESYLGRFIANILKHFSDERRVQGVRLSYFHWLMEWIPLLGLTVALQLLFLTGFLISCIIFLLARLLVRLLAKFKNSLNGCSLFKLNDCF